MWTWVGVFATASFAAAGLRACGLHRRVGGGVPGHRQRRGGLRAGRLCRGQDGQGARRRLGAGDERVVRGAHRGACSARAPVWVFALVMVWGFAVVADSAQFSALVTEYAPPDQVGTALTFQTSIGFLLTMVTIDVLPRVAGSFGWQYASLLLVPGPVAGALAMRALVRKPGTSSL